MGRIHRRDLGKAAFAATLGLTWQNWGSPFLAAAEELEPLQRFPRAMQDFLIREVRASHRQSVRAKRALQSREDAEAYVVEVRRKIASCFGPFPERTDLKPIITGELRRDGYRVEKLIFESRPNFPVTANLYIPDAARTTPAPGVIGSCGHSKEGKAGGTYQAFAQGLVRLGYVCLIFDPIGQGERLQFASAAGQTPLGPTDEHLRAGNPQFLVGEFFGAWRAWDAIRALDYLETRPEVDRSRLGITGNSGGGTMTTWLCGLDPRWSMAAPGCFVTTFLRNAENELAADTEQCPPRALALGLEHEDFLAAMAPKPVIILAKERDFFDVRGAEEAYRRLKRLYGLLGHPDDIALQVGPTSHGYTIENREAMYRWFDRATGISEVRREPKIVEEKEQDLWCTKTGQVAERKPATVLAFTREKAERLASERPVLAGDDLVAAITRVLRLPSPLPKEPPHARILRVLGARDYPRKAWTTYAVETEPGALAVCYYLGHERHESRPPRLGRRAILYVSHRSSDAELRSESRLRQRIAETPDLPVFTCDVRGIGESKPEIGGSGFDHPYGSDYFYAIHGIMLDRPYLGQKALDVIRVLRWLEDSGYDRVELIGNGWGGLAATFAALVCPKTVASLRLYDPIASFHAMATREETDAPLAILPPGVLAHFDLPDCYRALGGILQ